MFSDLTTGDNANKNHIFKMLPLDEPTFDINANSREIVVPDVFRKNGVGVQGDQLAETLFFTIDRYFDTVDLYDDSIKGIIQWETALKGKQFETGYSPIAFKDVTVVKGKMTFGWFLNNIITSNPGTVKFSVRFFSTVENTDENNRTSLKLNFSLSTKTQTITINPAISYDINIENGLPEVNRYDDLALVARRFKDSVYVGEADSAEEPIFGEKAVYGGIFFEDENIKPLSGPIDVFDNSGNIINKAYIFDLVDGNNLTLLTDAYCEDSGKISYQWYTNLDGKGFERQDTPALNKYIPTDDTTVVEFKKYFIKTDVNGAPGFELVKNLEPGEAFPNEDLQYYEEFNGFEIKFTGENKVTGDYKVQVKNRHGVASAYKESNIVRIPGPAELTVEVPEYEGNFLEDGKITLKAIGTTSQEKDIVHYTWVDTSNEEVLQTSSKNNLGFDGDGITLNIGDSWTSDVVSEEEMPVFDKIIKVSIQAERNGEKTELQSNQIRVTAPPYPAEVTISKDQYIANENDDVEIYVEASVKNDGNSDGFEYQWFKLVYDSETNNPENDILIEGANDSIYVVQGKKGFEDAEQGVYYCKVTNVLNKGKSEPVLSEQITIIRA